MLSKKNRIDIIVDGVLYHYGIKGSKIEIFNTETRETFFHNEGWSKKKIQAMTNQEVADIIQERNNG